MISAEIVIGTRDEIAQLQVHCDINPSIVASVSVSSDRFPAASGWSAEMITSEENWFCCGRRSRGWQHVYVRRFDMFIGLIVYHRKSPN